MLRHERRRPGLLAECPWLLTFVGPPPTLAELRAHVTMRLPQLPQFSCRLVADPLPFARPSWTPDPSFDIAHHVRSSDAPRHTGEKGWMRFVEERLSWPLDRERPLWELWLLPGEHAERFALVLHHHHALLDGQSGLHALRILLSASLPDRTPAATVAPLSRRGLLWRDAHDARRGLRSCGAMLSAARRNPRTVARRSHEIVAMVRTLTLERPAPRIPELNGHPPAIRRQPLTVELPIDEVMAICQANGCFPNVVYLTVVASGLGHWLRGRGRPTQGLVLGGGVAVDVGGDARSRRLGNYFSGLRVPLPVDAMDEVERLALVRDGARRVNSDALRGASALLAGSALLPLQMLGPTSAVAFGPRHFNVGVSYLAPTPGAWQLAGRSLVGLRSWTFLFADHVLTFVAQLFGEQMTINALVDPTAMFDASVLLEGIAGAMRSLTSRRVRRGDVVTDVSESTPLRTS